MFFIQKHSKDIGVAFDVGTSSVSVAVFSYSHTTPCRPRIIAIHRVAIDILSDIHAGSLQRTIVKQLKAVLGKVKESVGNNFVERIIFGLAAPFYIASTTRLTHTRKNAASPISKTEIDDLLSEGEKNFISSHTQGSATAITLFTKMLLKTFVNGYRVPQAIGTVGKTLDVSIRYEATTQAFIQELTSPLEALYPKAHMRITTIPLAYVQVLQDAIHDNNGVVIIDIGGEITEISIISDGILQHVMSIPAGVSFIVRRIAEALRMPYVDARFIIRRFTEQTLEAEKTLVVSNIITQAVADWQDACIKEFDAYAVEESLPARILLTGGGARIPAYKNAFTPTFLERIAMPGATSVSVARPEGLRDRFEAFSAFEGPEDFGLTCLTLICAQGDDSLHVPYN